MEKPLKIINIITRLNVGGPARQVILLSKELNDLGHTAFLVTGKLANYEDDMSYLYFQRS